jgi:membrane protease subunit (stomatin/prohibitin family)
MTEVQSFGEFYFKIDDPIVFLTQLAGGLSEVSAVDVSSFIRNFFVQGSIQELSRHDVITVQTKLLDVTTKLRASLSAQFQNRGLTLLDTKFGGFTFPYLEKLESEDPTYGVPLMAAMQSGQADKALEIIKIVESMRGIGQSSGAGIGAGLVGLPYLFGQQPAAPAAPGAYGGASVGGAVASTPQMSIEDKLLKLKDLLDKGLITQEEYQEKRKKYLDEL